MKANYWIVGSWLFIIISFVSLLIRINIIPFSLVYGLMLYIYYPLIILFIISIIYHVAGYRKDLVPKYQYIIGIIISFMSLFLHAVTFTT